jgi:hypothetical protein
MSAREAEMWQRGDYREQAAGPRPIAGCAEHVAAEHFRRKGRLLSDLQAALFKPFPGEAAPRDRSRLVIALSLFMEYVGENTDAIHIAGELAEYIKAIEELDRGTVRHFLKPAEVSNAPIDAGDIWLIRAKIATVIQWSIDDMGEARGRRSDAARSIARMHPYLVHILAPSTVDLPKLILSWHRKFETRIVKDERAQAFFDLRGDYLEIFAAHGRAIDHAGSSGLSLYQLAIKYVMNSLKFDAEMAATPEVVARIRGKVTPFRPKPRA